VEMPPDKGYPLRLFAHNILPDLQEMTLAKNTTNDLE
jgi:hypothetical protein